MCFDSDMSAKIRELVYLAFWVDGRGTAKWNKTGTGVGIDSACRKAR